MNIDWILFGKIAEWFGASVVGAIIVKLFDAIFLKYKDNRTIRKEKVDSLLRQVDDYADLADLYRFYANSSSKLVPIDNDYSINNWVENAKVENKILEPEDSFIHAISEMKGTTLEDEILHKIVTIRLASSHISDISEELDPSGDISKQFTELYVNTIYSIDKILEHKNQGDPFAKFDKLNTSLHDASETRKRLRASLNRLVK